MAGDAAAFADLKVTATCARVSVWVLVDILGDAGDAGDDVILMDGDGDDYDDDDDITMS